MVAITALIMTVGRSGNFNSFLTRPGINLTTAFVGAVGTVNALEDAAGAGVVTG
jgi:hypothetical protein